jgi:hypothetical protein
MLMPADKRIAEFRNHTGNFAFTCITKANQQTFAEDLAIRVKDAFRINQQDAALCGPAAFMYCIAKYKADAYANYVIDLALTGKGSLGNLQVKPGKGCLQGVTEVKAQQRNGALPPASSIAPVDWVALASLRDSSNTMMSMKSVKTQVAGITDGGTLAGWFNATGWYRSGAHTNNFTPQPLDNLLKANQSRSAGPVCLFIQAKIIIQGGMDKFGKPGSPKVVPTANHWIVLVDDELNTGIRFDGSHAPLNAHLAKPDWEKQKLFFNFYTWGSTTLYQLTKRNPNLTVGQFLPYYYGHVSAAKI